VRPYRPSPTPPLTNPCLLSIDWDFFVGCGELVFDSPFWGTRDTDVDRSEAWVARALKRGGSSFEVLRQDFPLFGNPLELKSLAGLPCYAAVTHSDAYGLLEQLQIKNVINLDSHHDLFSSSGDPKRVRPGNWAGLALEHGVISSYTCVYPAWHEGVRVTEGFDLTRTNLELPSTLSSFNLSLQRGMPDLEKAQFEAVLLVQSPAWTNPLYDSVLLELCQGLNATLTSPLLERSFRHDSKTAL
jgi:hypothetical protein